MKAIPQIIFVDQKLMLGWVKVLGMATLGKRNIVFFPFFFNCHYFFFNIEENVSPLQ